MLISFILKISIYAMIQKKKVAFCLHLNWRRPDLNATAKTYRIAFNGEWLVFLQYARVLSVDVGLGVIVVRPDGWSNRLDKMMVLLLCRIIVIQSGWAARERESKRKFRSRSLWDRWTFTANGKALANYTSTHRPTLYGSVIRVRPMFAPVERRIFVPWHVYPNNL